jgi:hypothetical protein
MTSPFDWQNRPRPDMKDLKRSEIGQRNSNGGKTVPSTDRKTFHYFLKAVPSVRTKA